MEDPTAALDALRQGTHSVVCSLLPALRSSALSVFSLAPITLITSLALVTGGVWTQYEMRNGKASKRDVLVFFEDAKGADEPGFLYTCAPGKREKRSDSRLPLGRLSDVFLQVCTHTHTHTYTHFTPHPTLLGPPHHTTTTTSTAMTTTFTTS
jgi:hypothetical protein